MLHPCRETWWILWGIILEMGKLIRIDGENGWSLVQINPGEKRAEIQTSAWTWKMIQIPTVQ